MQLTEYEFTTEMRIGDYKDSSYKIRDFGVTARDAVICLVADTVEDFMREEHYDLAKLKAEKYISQRLGTSDWTVEQFCEGRVDLWSSDYQLIQVYHIHAVRQFESI